MLGLTVQVDFNTSQITRELETATARALEIVGSKAETNAKLLCPVDTGALRDSIRHGVDGCTVYVGAAESYAPYVELGTGKFFSMPPAWVEFHAKRGRGLPRWVYRDRDGNFRVGYPQPPRPFIRPSLEGHTQEYQNDIETELRQGG